MDGAKSAKLEFKKQQNMSKNGQKCFKMSENGYLGSTNLISPKFEKIFFGRFFSDRYPIKYGKFEQFLRLFSVFVHFLHFSSNP